MQGKSVSIDGVFDYPDDGRDGRLAFAVLVPTVSLQNYDECWVFAWPVPPDLTDAMVMAVSPGKLGSVHEGRLNTSYGSGFDGEALFRARPSALTGPVAAILGMTLGLGSVWTRKLELASALHAGVSRSSMMLLMFIQAFVWVVSGMMISVAVVATLSTFVERGDTPRGSRIVDGADRHRGRGFIAGGDHRRAARKGTIILPIL